MTCGKSSNPPLFDMTLGTINTDNEAADNAAVIERMSNILANPDLADVALVSDRDGSKTLAHKNFLGSCSPVFMRKLMGGFAEATNVSRDEKRRKPGSVAVALGYENLPAPVRTVTSAFRGEVLAAIVSFATTNDAALLWSGEIEVLKEIFEAAEYYQISGLIEKVKQQLIHRAQSKPLNACRVLEAVWEKWAACNFVSNTAGDIAHGALLAIRTYPDEALLGCGCLCEDAMQEVLAMENISTGEESLFNALLRWSNHDGSDVVIRRRAMERLATCFSFEHMSPSFLTGVVSKCGFVSNRVLFETFQALALRAECKHGLYSRKRDKRALPHWCGTGSVMYTSVRRKHGVKLLGRTLKEGCWSWEYRLKKVSKAYFIGLASGDIDENDFLGNQRCGFAYGASGYRIRNGYPAPSRGPQLSEGDLVRVDLDCDVGTLSIRVNDGSPFLAFSDMRTVGGPNMFKPAVSILNPDRIRLVSFRKARKPL